MKSHLLTLVALCGATMSSIPLWAATEWEDPTVQTVTIDLEAGGTYFVYHPATKMFMVNGNSYNTQLSLAKKGLKIRVKPAEDSRFSVSGWTLEMPDAPANNGGKPKYIWLTGDGANAYVDFNLQTDGHYVWKITKNADSDTYRIKMPDEDPNFGLEAQDGLYANAYMGWDGLLNEDGTMNNTVVMPTIDKNSAGYEKAELDWAFVTEDEYALYEAKLVLKDALEYAVEKEYTDYAKYEEIYNGSSASVTEITEAAEALISEVDTWLAGGATEDNPIDMTGKIKNADFPDGVKDGWDNNMDMSRTAETDKYYNENGDLMFRFAEKWVAGGNSLSDLYVQQTIKGLPQGKYRLQADVIGYQQSDNTMAPEELKGAYLFADGGSGETRVETRTYEFTSDNRPVAHNETVDFVVFNDEATIGFRTISTNMNWVGVDNFKLYYLGKSDNFAKSELQKTIDEALAYQGELEENQAKYSNAGYSKFEANLALAQEAMGNDQLTEDSVIAVRLSLIKSIDNLKNDVAVYAQIMDVVDGKLDEHINNYEPYAELSNNPEAFIKTYDYTDAVEAAYNSGEFDPNDFDKLSASIDSVFREDILDMVNADLTNDLYGLLQSPDFTNGASGWNGGPTANNHVAEVFNKQYDVYQELDGLPEGAYKITAKGYYRPSGNDVIDAGWDDGITNNVYAYLYGNENTVALHHICDELSDTPYITKEDGSTNDYSFAALGGKYIPNDLASAEVAFGQGKYANEVTSVVLDGKLRFGVRMQSSESLSNNWSAFDEFRIVYMGNSVEYYLPTISILYDEASALYTKITGFEAFATVDAITKLETAMTNASLVTESSTIEEAKSVINELTESISYANKSIEVVLSLSDLVNDVYGERGENLQNAGYDLSAVYEVVDEVSVTLENNEIESVEQANEYIVQINTLLTQTIQGGQIAGASKDNPVELSDLIINPGFSIYDEESGVTTDSGDGWIQERDGGDVNFRISAGEFYNNNSFDIHQTLYGLTPGFYKLTCNAFYREGWPMDAAAKYRDDKEQLNAMLYAGPEDSWVYTPIMSIIEEGQPTATASQNTNVADSLTTEENPIEYWFIPNAMEDAGPAFNKGLYSNELYFEVKEGQTYANIGIRKDEHVDGDWTIFDNFKLYYYGSGEENRPDGVQNVENGVSEVVRSTYYTIGGAQIAQPTQRGFYIRKDEMRDGSVKTYKFMLK